MQYIACHDGVPYHRHRHPRAHTPVPLTVLFSSFYHRPTNGILDRIKSINHPSVQCTCLPAYPPRICPVRLPDTAHPMYCILYRVRAVPAVCAPQAPYLFFITVLLLLFFILFLFLLPFLFPTSSPAFVFGPTPSTVFSHLFTTAYVYPPPQPVGLSGATNGICNIVSTCGAARAARAGRVPDVNTLVLLLGV